MNSLYEKNGKIWVIPKRDALRYYEARYKKVKKCFFKIEGYDVELWKIIEKHKDCKFVDTPSGDYAKIDLGSEYQPQYFYVVDGPINVVFQEIVLPDWDTAKKTAFDIGDGECFPQNWHTIIAKTYHEGKNGIHYKYLVRIKVLSGYPDRAY